MIKSDIIDIGLHWIDIVLHLHGESASAIRVSDTGKIKDAVWLPKSQVEFEKAGGRNVCVTLPEWLAIEKVLV